MKAYEKKKLFKDFCRKQVKEGLVNDASGGWRRAEATKAMDRDMRAGYKLR